MSWATLTKGIGTTSTYTHCIIIILNEKVICHIYFVMQVFSVFSLTFLSIWQSVVGCHCNLYELMWFSNSLGKDFQGGGKSINLK